jgi:hypothetical protein
MQWIEEKIISEENDGTVGWLHLLINA